MHWCLCRSFRASSGWLHRKCGIREILLGVHEENSAATKAYEKAGFVFCKSRYITNDDPGIKNMSLLLS